MGRREWLETEAPLADVRNLLALPSTAVRGLRGALSGLREIAHEIQHLGDTTSELKDALRAGPEIARSTAGGAYPPAEFDAWIM